MQWDIKNVGDYLVAISNQGIQIGDWYLFTWYGQSEIQRFSEDQIVDKENHKFLYDTACRKIVGHLPLGQSEALDGLDILPDLIEYVKDEWCESDIRSAIMSGFLMCGEREYSKELEDEIIESLKNKKNSSLETPIKFECKTEWINSKGEFGDSWSEIAIYEESINDYDAWLRPKKIGNKLIGDYLYN